jgi:hypothetical protein
MDVLSPATHLRSGTSGRHAGGAAAEPLHEVAGVIVRGGGPATCRSSTAFELHLGSGAPAEEAGEGAALPARSCCEPIHGCRSSSPSTAVVRRPAPPPPPTPPLAPDPPPMGLLYCGRRGRRPRAGAGEGPRWEKRTAARAAAGEGDGGAGCRGRRGRGRSRFFCMFCWRLDFLHP